MLLVFGAIFLQATVYVILRMLKGKIPSWKLQINQIYVFPKTISFSDVHWSVTCTIFGILGSFESLVAVLIFAPLCLPDSGMDKFYLVLIGILSFFAQIGLVLAAQFENAATVALIRKACDVIFAFIFQLVFFHVS